MKCLILFLALLALLLIAPALTTAQDDTGWPVIERCVGEPTAPPEGWTFEGTILLKGYAGIHGVNANWETPHVLVFLNYKYLIEEKAGLPGGALSPDGKWYASPFGIQVQEYSTNNIFITLSEVRVYSTEADEALTVPIYVTQFFQGDYGQVFWIDNENFFYPSWEDVVFNPFSGTSQSGEFLRSLTGFYFAGERSYFSPDWTRSLHQPDSWSFNDLENNTAMSKPNLDKNSPIAWPPDSQHFVGLQQTYLTLFDRNGKVVEKIYPVAPEETWSFKTREWSSDNRYLPVFVRKTWPPSEQRLYLFDFDERQIVDTCATGSSVAWTFDSTKMFFQDDGRIRVLDMSDWQLYTVAYHDGEVIGWRAD